MIQSKTGGDNDKSKGKNRWSRAEKTKARRASEAAGRSEADGHGRLLFVLVGVRGPPNKLE